MFSNKKVIRFFSQTIAALLGIAIGVALGWLAIRGAEWAAVKESLRSVSLATLMLALLIALLSSWIRAMRWRFTWASASVSTFRLFQVENAALGINNISPIRMWDEMASLGMLVIRDKLPATTVVATIVMTRAQDLVFTLCFVGLAILIAPELTEFARPLALMSVFVFITLIVVLNWGKVVRRIPVLKRLPGVTSFGEAIDALWAKKRRLAFTFCLTATYWLILGPAAFFIGRGMGIELSVFQFTLIALGSIFFATATPSLPGAVGSFEFAAVSLLSLWDVPKETAIGFAVLLHLILFLPPVFIAIIVLPREGIASISAWKQRARNLQKVKSSDLE